MKKITLFILSLLVIAATGFADIIVLDNQTSYPKENSKMAVQWASTAKEVQEANQALMHGSKMNTGAMHILTQSGKIKLNIPASAEFFRVLVWTKGKGDPDLHTNWVDIVPNKTYTLTDDLLVPCVLMPGTGC